MDEIKGMIISGKTIYVGEWIDNKHYRDIANIIGSHKKLFVQTLPSHSVNKKIFCNIRCFNKEAYYQKSNLTIYQSLLLREWVEKLLKNGILRVSSSQWSSPIYVNCVNDKLEVNVDYNVLNNKTIDNYYYIPTHQEVFKLIKPSSLFTKIVIKDAYYQLPIEIHSRHKTAFATDFGNFEFAVMNPNLKNADAFLQKTIEEILRSVDQKSIAIYLDQILIFTDSLDDHIYILKKVLKLFMEYWIRIDIKESRFLVCEVDYLNVKIDFNGLRMDPLTKDIISNYSVPTTKSDLRQFLKLTNQFKFFIHDYDKLVEPLNRLSNSSFRFNWNQDAQYSFDLIRYSFLNASSCYFFDKSSTQRIV